jgi:hypothetical protein
MQKRSIVRGIAYCASVVWAAMASAAALAEGHIDVSLKLAEPDKPGARVIVTLTNSGDAPVHVMMWSTPFVAAGGRLPRGIFKVTDVQGNTVPYRGQLVNFGPPTLESFLLVAPGEVLSKQVDLAREYKFEPNQIYTIGYDLNLTSEPDAYAVPSTERAFFLKPTQTEASAEPVTVFFGDQVSLISTKADDDDLKCSVDRELVILGARSEAQRRLYAAEQAMEERYSLHVEDGKLFYRFTPHPRYTRWFGTHDDAEPNRASNDWGLNNNARAYETVVATVKRFNASRLDAKCGCPGFHPDTAAHVVKDEPYRMYFCEKFFALPKFAPFASQAGTIMHEFTHFNAFYPGTDDHDYGQAAAEKYAKENRSKAVLNADNFEFFFTDTTPYEE